MKLFLITALTMMAFASNSILNRMALGGGHIDPSSFAAVRIVAGAIALGLMLAIRREKLPLWEKSRILGALSLAAYMIGFSLAYDSLDAGLGALILFGVVQVALFIYGAIRGETPTQRELIGASIAFIGLLIALWPSEDSVATLSSTALMVIAGLGWAAYTLAGRGSQNPLASTAANFLFAMPLLLLLLIGQTLNISVTGVALAVSAGAITSGMGYALWYWVLPQIGPSTAAVVQLSVPIIAIVAGAVLLGEVISITVIIAAGFVVGGIGLAVTKRSVQVGRT
ncbi:DMT family transporter [Ascidiaceihabitans sp.]|nr:DMT family transporter [Ascidiaceihabitans sp.]MDA9136242.1 DMT family transporter [Ascidiaceihabitans sp.]